MARFTDRMAAGRELLPKLSKYTNDLNAIVVGLPRGGMVTANEIAKGLNLPLGYLIVKKIGAPGNSELAIGAVAESGDSYISKDMLTFVDMGEGYIKSEEEKKKEEARIRSELYAGVYKNPDLTGKTIILVDDGLATGITMTLAVTTVIKKGARKVVVAVPAGTSESISKFRKLADEVICLDNISNLSAVGEYYDNFPQIEDAEVLQILKNAKGNFNNK